MAAAVEARGWCMKELLSFKTKQHKVQHFSSHGCALITADHKTIIMLALGRYDFALKIPNKISYIFECSSARETVMYFNKSVGKSKPVELDLWEICNLMICFHATYTWCSSRLYFCWTCRYCLYHNHFFMLMLIMIENILHFFNRVELE